MDWRRHTSGLRGRCGRGGLGIKGLGARGRGIPHAREILNLGLGKDCSRKGRKGRKGREGRTGAPTKSGRVRGEDGRGRQGLRGGGGGGLTAGGGGLEWSDENGSRGE